MSILRTAALSLPLALLPTLPALADGHVTLETEAQKGSYAVGVMVGTQISQQFGGMGADMDAMAAGIADTLREGDPAMTLEEAQATAQGYMQELQAAAQAAEQSAFAERAEAAKARGEAFLAENATAEGVTVTESGLQYRVMVEGEGESPTIADQVVVHYTGRLLDGTVFDSSVARGEPATFPVGGVIAGWIEALQLMKPGGKFEVWIPSDMAYGERGTGRDIGPNEVLNFEMELIAIVSP